MIKWKRTALSTIKINHLPFLNITNICEYLESDQHQKALSKTIISVDIIPNQTTLITIIKNILIAVNNVNLCWWDRQINKYRAKRLGVKKQSS